MRWAEPIPRADDDGCGEVWAPAFRRASAFQLEASRLAVPGRVGDSARAQLELLHPARWEFAAARETNSM